MKLDIQFRLIEQIWCDARHIFAIFCVTLFYYNTHVIFHSGRSIGYQKASKDKRCFTCAPTACGLS